VRSIARACPAGPTYVHRRRLRLSRLPYSQKYRYVRPRIRFAASPHPTCVLLPFSGNGRSIVQLPRAGMLRAARAEELSYHRIGLTTICRGGGVQRVPAREGRSATLPSWARTPRSPRWRPSGRDSRSQAWRETARAAPPGRTPCRPRSSPGNPRGPRGRPSS